VPIAARADSLSSALASLAGGAPASVQAASDENSKNGDALSLSAASLRAYSANYFTDRLFGIAAEK
jgi:hypothetical protein